MCVCVWLCVCERVDQFRQLLYVIEGGDGGGGSAYLLVRRSSFFAMLPAKKLVGKQKIACTSFLKVLS